MFFAMMVMFMIYALIPALHQIDENYILCTAIGMTIYCFFVE